VVDTREHYPYRFSKQQATTVRVALPAGDYAVRSEDGTPVAVVERKSLADLAGALNTGTLVFELAMLARVQVRYPEIPIVFLETRPLAEEWTFRYLGAALAEYESEPHTGPQMRAAELPIDYGDVRPPTATGRRKGGA